MGMSASQARLLSITARLSDNENTAQSVSYSKQRLADETEQVNQEYTDAQNLTKLTVITGYSNSSPTYTDISYGLLTSEAMQSGKQYAITDTKGRMLVTKDIAEAYEAGNGDLNVFLAKMGYSIATNTLTYDAKTISSYDSAKTNTDSTKAAAAAATMDSLQTSYDNQIAAQKAIHEAWDKYYETIGISLGDYEHDVNGVVTFGYTTFKSGDKQAFDGYAMYARSTTTTDTEGNKTTTYAKDANGNQIYDPISYEGTTKEQRELYDYAVSLTQAYFQGTTGLTGVKGADSNSSGTASLKTAESTDNASAIAYYKNIFNKMQSDGYFCYTTTYNDTLMTGTNAKGANAIHYIYTNDMSKTVVNDNALFADKIKKGELMMQYYSSSSKSFVATSLADDETVTEVKDESAISKAETKYEQDLTKLEQKDKKFDLELKKLDTEHSALQTEYDSVKSVIQKNVESSFKTFSA
ncbi:MAG: hypothetical protein LKG27_07435 [Clostridiaceae bacterium]|jgi:hypothetical protein|nr:hypothetical protein [Clostridiaceae bacterium]